MSWYDEGRLTEDYSQQRRWMFESVLCLLSVSQMPSNIWIKTLTLHTWNKSLPIQDRNTHYTWSEYSHSKYNALEVDRLKMNLWYRPVLRYYLMDALIIIQVRRMRVAQGQLMGRTVSNKCKMIVHGFPLFLIAPLSQLSTAGNAAVIISCTNRTCVVTSALAKCNCM